MHRRKFVKALAATTAASAFTGLALSAKPAIITIQEVIDLILKDIPSAPFATTVDTIKSGDASNKVTGIVTTMFATIDVIEKAVTLGANFIIAHEPTFYNHADDTKWLEANTVYLYKKALLDKHQITVWRCHDYIHAHKPDGVLTGVLDAMGWRYYQDTENPNMLKIPAQPLSALVSQAKNKLGITHLRYVGKPAAICSRIGILPGAAGGKTQINLCNAEKPDLLMVGEVSEWETLEYFRDLQASGGNSALLIMNHIPSEEPGMEWMASWLKPKLGGLAVTHIPAGSAVTWG